VVKNKEISKWFLKNLFAISAIVVAVANLWLFSKLAPLSQDVAILGNQVSANESDIRTLREDVYEELKYLRERIDAIYGLLR